MYDTSISFKFTCDVLIRLVNKGLLDKATSTRERAKETRCIRRRMGLDPYGVSPRGKHWYKTTKDGEIFISNMKELWELSGKDNHFIGKYPFDFIGRVGGMEPPIKNSYYGGLDPAWVANIYIPPIKLRSDMRIGTLK